MQVTEIFFSIQGESLDAGLPCIFIRLTGCNLRCSYCDTPYAYDGGVEMAMEAIINRIRRFPCRRVAVTGGEPLLQKETPMLIRRLMDAGYRVLMETNGSLDIGVVDPRCARIVDVKCPSSGEADQHHGRNFARLSGQDQVKFVIGDREDYQYTVKMLKKMPDGFPGERILLSSVFGRLNPAELAEWMLKDGLDARLHLQLHKIIWPDRDRGV